MKPILLLLSILFFNTETDPPQINWQADRKLEWSDFTRRTGPPEMFKAFSYTGISYVIDAPEGTVNIEVTPYFLPEESWVHIEYLTNELLNHEQGHFDIAAVYAKELDDQLKPYEIDADAFTERDLAKKIEAMFYVVFAEMDDCQKRYDAETLHGTAVEAQARWDKWFNQKLSRLDTAAHNTPK